MASNKPSLRQAVLVTVGIGLSGAFAYFSLRGVRFSEVWESLRTSNYWWLLPATGALAVATFIRALRWFVLFAPETRPPLRAVTSALLIGYFFNNVLPLRAGEAMRVVVLRRRWGVSLAEASATIVLERVFDVLCLVAVFFVALPWLPELSWTRPVAALAAVLLLSAAALVVVLRFFGARPLHYLMRPLARMPFLSNERIVAGGENILHGLAAVRRPRLAMIALFWTALSWIVLAISFWLVTLSFGFNLSPIAGVLLVTAISLALVLPSTPAALGVFEGATLVALTAYQVPRAEGLSYALVLHAMNTIPFLVAGYFALSYVHGPSLLRSRRALLPFRPS